MYDVRDWYNERADAYHQKWKRIPYIWVDIEERRFLSGLYQQVGKRILVAGGGTGRHAIPLAKNNKVVMIDIAKNMLNMAKRVMTEAGVSKNLECLEMDVQCLEFADETFDFVLATGGVLSYCNDIDKALLQLSRVLKPGGLLIGSVHSRRSKRPKYAYEINYYSFHNIGRLLNSHGLKIKKSEGFFLLRQLAYIFMRVRGTTRLRTVLYIERALEKTKLLRQLCPHIYFMAEKL